MSDTISVTGLVATTPRHITTSEGLAITSFRLASSQRRYDRTQQRWIDADTNWYTVSCFRGLASNAADSVVKGDRVMVSGRLKIRDWENTDRSGTTVEIEAENLGHDLFWGTSTFTRTLTSGSDESGNSVAENTDFTDSANDDGWVAVSA
ncbi:MAG: single-stranded DNA-binding protein [Aurantimicrobium sp.]|nr:single-stranded DNA-binding protein [Aurantimicrobium sp.]